jgi:hypothetical protein
MGVSGMCYRQSFTGDEERIYKWEGTKNLSSRFCPRRSEILWKFFFSPRLSDTGSSVRARAASVQLLFYSVFCEMSLLIHTI